MVPETKGKTLEEIEKTWRKRKLKLESTPKSRRNLFG